MSRTKITLLIGVLALTVAAASCGGNDSPSGPRSAALFRLRDTSHGETFRVEITAPETIREAEALLNSGRILFSVGRLRPGNGGFNSPWSWHLDPETILFEEVTIEACQTWPSAVENELNYWLYFGHVCLAARVVARER